MTFALRGVQAGIGDKASCISRRFRPAHSSRTLRGAQATRSIGTPLPAASPGGRREPRPRPASSPGADLSVHVTRPAASGARGRSSAEAWPGRAEREQGRSAQRAREGLGAAPARSRARKLSLGAGTPGGWPEDMAGDAVQVGDLSAPTGWPDGAEDPGAPVEPGMRSPSRARAGLDSRWRRRPGRRKGCRLGFYYRTPSSGPPRQAAGAAGGPHCQLRGQRRVPVPFVSTPYSPGSSAFGFWQVPLHLEQVPGTLPAADRRSARPMPLPRTTNPRPPPLVDVFTMVLTPPRWAPVGGSAQVTSLGQRLGSSFRAPSLPVATLQADRWSPGGACPVTQAGRILCLEGNWAGLLLPRNRHL